MYQDQSKLIICKASAGSGKTFNLVKEYLKLAFSDYNGSFSPMRFKHILAITFTNKAATEMKERVMFYLDEITKQGEKSAMAQKIVEEMVLESKNKISKDATMAKVKEYAPIVKSAILHNYSDLSVFTIDSFMQRVVRTFAYDLNLPMNYDVSLDQDELIEMAVDEMASMAGTAGHDELSKFLQSCLKDNLEEGKNYSSVKREILGSVGSLFKEDSIDYIEQLKDIKLSDFERMKDEWYTKNREAEAKVRGLGQQGLKLLDDKGIPHEALYQGRYGIGVYFEKIATDGELKLGGKHVVNFVAGETNNVRDAYAQYDDAVASIKANLCSIYCSIEKEIIGYNTRKAILRYMPTMALLNVLKQIIDKDSMENEVLHISEFNRAIAKVVQEEPMPFVYERVGTKYHNFLIDEFQDTSKQQWMNLVPLLENGISEGHTSLVVGDGKQAIYRFRNGDVRQFMNLPKVDPSFTHGQGFQNDKICKNSPLNESRRSYEAIVNFNNDFYKWLASRYTKSLGDIYKDGEQKVIDKNVGKGFVKVAFIPSEQQPKKGQGVEIEQEVEAEPKIPKMHQAILDEIRHQQSLNYKNKDIMVLARNNKTLSKIGEFLSGNNIPVVSNDSFLLGNSKAVLAIKAMLHFLLDSADRVSALNALILLRELGVVSQDNDFENVMATNHDVVDMTAILRKEGIDFDADRLRAMTLYDCCVTLIDKLRLNGIDEAFVYTLLNKVASFENRHSQNLVELLEYLDERIYVDENEGSKKKKMASQTSSERDAVKLMTIHSSKGLEAKVVIYVVTKSRNMSDAMWVKTNVEGLPVAMVSLSSQVSTKFDDERDKEQLNKQVDDVNVMYVATTRPREKLFVFCDGGEKKNNPKDDKKKAKKETKEELDKEQINAVELMRKFINDTTSNGWNMVDMKEYGDWYTRGEDSRCESEKTVDESIENQGKEEENKIIEESEVLQPIPYADCMSKIKIANQAEQIFELDRGENIRRGLMIHEVLSGVKTEADITMAVDRYAKRNDMTDEARLELQRCVEGVVKNEKVAPFFATGLKVLNEHELIYEDKVQRPDRVVINGDEATVIDFKTGSPNVTYYGQVNRYCDAMKEMGYKQVTGYLIYIGGDRVEVEKV